MTTQTVAPTKSEELIEKCGLKIGAEVWQELEEFFKRYEKNSGSEFSPDNVIFSDTEGKEYKEKDFVNNLKKMISAMSILARDSKREFPELLYHN